MDETSLPPPPPLGEPEHCYRHPNVETGVHCTRCGRPICPECMIPAPVGHQCPECVNEARREFRRGPGRRIAAANIRRRASVTTGLMVIIGAVYLLEVVTGGPGSLSITGGPSSLKLIDLGASIGLARIPPNGDLVGIAVGQSWRLVSAMFLHAGLLHIAFNVYALWIFGTIVEQDLGRIRFLAIYFVTGICASAASYAFASSPLEVAVGASGAIFGILGAFVVYNYRRRHLALAAARLRSAVMILVLNLIITFSVPVIDWRAHVGGFITGLFAGLAAEGIGSRSTRKTILVIGFAGLLAIAWGLVVWRTSQLRTQFGPF